ncbi:hypothetical protein BHYA_0279g00010 [Botrytis hyacinthi]|uniref:Glycoside hydrolase family 71 protein n=1 Tax=Botrytis hyacinthi TaxID=278943 RepID=A0A4Z1GBT1_9HELO|nr:hypothetical protein BHYA_0279g00010 [Botrytis hyacinthi]
MEAHIDAFALNIAFGDEGNQNSIANALSAAELQGFKLFFSFDYAVGISDWPLGTVVNYINQYSSSSSYFQYLGKPFVSTFEGPASSKDWSTIKSSTGCFFMPDWSSLGAKAALKLDEADGLFSWAAWPWGTDDMDTHVDASYLQFLNQTGTPLPYMMPVSPWFFTSLPGYHKNWMWRSHDLWFDRWQEVWYVRPDLVEIISWNDHGESHYIGPLHSDSYGAFNVDTGNPPYNYALDMPHDGWRTFLPYVIDMYKFGTASVTQESLVTWYRLSPANTACSSDNTSANTHTQIQVDLEPAIVAEDNGKSVEPTCTSNCGSPCTANCHTTGTPTSTECATETATNYWVSCASSTCVTTSSNTVTGCAVQPSVTTSTATDYCPLVALPTGDDGGSDEDRTITPIWTVIQTTISERVSISGSLYTVTSGSITVNGVGYSVPAVVTSSVMVLGGLTATLYLPAVVSSASITAPGYGTNPLTPTSTVVPVQSTTTSLLPIPTRSDPRDQQAYCFRQPNDGKYVPFNITGEQEVLFSICNQGNTLSPGGPAYTYVYTDPTGVNVIAQANWASDQTGCNPEDG